jgi:hypothetical protein
MEVTDDRLNVAKECVLHWHCEAQEEKDHSDYRKYFGYLPATSTMNFCAGRKFHTESIARTSSRSSSFILVS